VAREIRTRYLDSTCIRCGKRFHQFDRVMHSRPIGVWCIERCIPEFPRPEGDTALALGVLERLESEERLNGYTEGILERYRVTGRMSLAHVETLLPQDRERRRWLANPPARPPRTIEDLGLNKEDAA
jgi:hypothetical protein